MTQLLDLDLSSGEWVAREVADIEQEYLGGLGVNSCLLYRWVPAGCDPLGPENILFFGAGPLVGTALPTACRTEATAKSPLSGRFGTASAGAEFGARLKMTGFSYLAIRGESPEPVYLLLSPGRVELKKAGDLWGLDTWMLVDEMRSRHGADCQVASIGPAGENLVRFASIQNNYYASWARTGLGAVMGSKRLKAIVVTGWADLQVPDRRRFNLILREAYRKVQGDPTFQPFRRFGSQIVSDAFNTLNTLPMRNFTRGSSENWAATRGRKAFEEGYKVKDVACYSCPVACAHWSRVKEGPYAGYETKGIEVGFTTDWGAKLDLEDIAEILLCVEVCNRQGMDVMSAASVLALAAQAAEEGVISPEEAPKFGDGPRARELLVRIARREGLGDLLAEGVMKVGEMRPELKPFAVHVKGVDIPHRDPRGKWDVWTLGNLTNTRGGDTLRTRSPVEQTLGKTIDYMAEALEVGPDYVAAMDMPEELKKEIFGDPPERVDIPKMAKYAEDLIVIINSVGMCIRPPVLRSLGPDFYARALAAVTGREYTAEKVLEAAARIWDLQHAFNVLAGERPEEYRFPERFYNEPLPGATRTTPPLSREGVEKAVRAYFEARGWDLATGWPGWLPRQV